jgi:hypothetical protein
LQRHKQQVLARLTPAGNEAFAAGFDDTFKRYTELKAKLEQVRAQATEEQHEREEEQRQESSRAQAELEHTRQQLEAKGRIALEELQAGLADLQAMWNATSRAQAIVPAEIARLQRQAGRVAPPPAPRGKTETSREQAARAQSRRMVRQLEQQIQLRAIEGARWQMVGNNILQRCGVLWAKYQQDVTRLSEEQASLDRESKKLDADAKRLSKATRVGSVQLLEVKAQLAAFSTYEEFSYEREKQRVLDSLTR